MARGGKFGNRQYGKRRRSGSKDKGSDESDEDYIVGADEEFEDSEDYCSSLEGEESEESLGEFQDDDEDEKQEKKLRKVGRLQGRKGVPNRTKNGVRKTHKRRRVPRKEDNDEDNEDGDSTYDVSDGDDDDEYDVEDDDYEDEDDEEFKLDEVDLDDEDELAVRKKNKKVGRPPLREKGFVKRQKRKRNSKVMKKTIRKKLTKSRGFQKKSPGSDGALTRSRSEKKSGPGKRRLVRDSDSASMSSGSSHFEYTTSEEEREQVREASEFCKDLTPSLRNFAPKNIIQEGISCQQRKQVEIRGKEKEDNLKSESGKQVCGICLSEEGKKTVQGTLNCCSHYFCFACIMEWSKVETRCPLCKQRFVTISKPARSNSGFDLRTVVIQVPERDQIYQPSEEELRGYLDPYENVICTECQQGGDDALMLLCDLCDSPAHTYCVGLGREVPDGNWYCDGCRPTALGSSYPQAPNSIPDQRTTNFFPGRSPPVENVREAIDLNVMYVPETPMPQGTGFFSSSRHHVGDFQAVAPSSGPGVLTVSERRRIQRQIHHLINNRMSELGGRVNGMLSTTLGNNLVQSQIERGREIAYPRARAPERMMSDHTFPQGRLQTNFTPSFQNMNLFPTWPSHSRSPLIQGQTSTSANDSTNGMLQTGLPGISVGIDSRLGYEQLHPCSSRSSAGDASMPSYGNGEAHVTSRTFQGTLPAPF